MRLILVLLTALISSCSPTTETLPEGFDPSGYYSKDQGQYIFHVWRTNKGAWAIETRGIAPTTSPDNACWTVSVGSMQHGRLISSSDLNIDFSGTLTERDLRYGGIIVQFGQSTAMLSNTGNNDRCPLSGKYVKRDPEHPEIKRYKNWAHPVSTKATQPGPIIGDPNARFTKPN